MRTTAKDRAIAGFFQLTAGAGTWQNRWGRVSRLLGIDDGQPLKQSDVAESLVSANELIDGGGLLNRESHRELKGVEGVDLPRLPVPGDEVAG